MPFPYSIADFVAEIPNALSDDANRLGGNYAPFVERAIIQRYSLDAPLLMVSDIDGNGTNLLPLPIAPGAGGDLPVFEPNFSVIRSIEYPVGQQPPQYVLDSDLQVYHSPTEYQIMLNFDSPPVGDTLRVRWTARHLPDGSTVPDKDFYAVVDFAASLAAEKLATFYVGTGDSTMQADVVNYRSKSQEMLNIAKAMRRRYFNHMGIDGDAVGGTEQAPAFSMGNQFLEQASGVDRLVHGKYTR